MAVEYKKYLDLTHDTDYIDLYKYYSKETIFDIMGVSRQENPHSSFIRWMLGSGDSYGVGDLPFRKFLETVLLIKDKYYGDAENTNRWPDPSNIFNLKNEILSQNPDILDDLRYGRYKIQSLDMANEVVLDGARRADIFAMATLDIADRTEPLYLLVLIENKVHSQEHNKQTKQYVEDLEFEKDSFHKAMGRLMGESRTLVNEQNCLKLFVYLNAATNAEVKQSLKEGKNRKHILPVSCDYISLTYQHLMDGVIEPLCSLANDEAKTRLEEYIRCLGQAKTSCIEDSKGGIRTTDDYLVMAISKNEKARATNLFKHYTELILEIIKDVNTDDFMLGESERDFWRSLANVYRLIIGYLQKQETESVDWADNVEKLREIVESANKAKKLYSFNGEEYESRPTKDSGRKNVGMLCRDIIACYAKDMGNDSPDKLRDLRDHIQEDISLNWLREGILFSDEIKALDSKGQDWAAWDDANYKVPQPEGSKRKNRYITTSFESFEDNFFSLWEKDKKNRFKSGNGYDVQKDEASNRFGYPYELEIKLPDGRKAYVAKYWTDYELWKLIDIIKDLSGKEYKVSVEG